ncbi:MAG: UbiA family prenyltransferase [Chlamydiales bacterium]|nr:UbiA family prenyltransferase [Chlamydiales bacterium]
MQKQKLTFSTFKELTKLEFSLFALPFVLTGALIPFAKFDFFFNFRVIEALRFLWIVPAFMAARLSGMAFNQLIDCKIDAKNARTKERPIPSGRATPQQAGMIAWGCLFAFVLMCAFINKSCFYLGLIAAFLIVLYSYMKRIHMVCHFVLGSIHFLGPVMAAAVLTGGVEKTAVLLGLMSGLSISATDIAWAIQDVSFDVKEKLHSIPARLGAERSLWVARGAHLFVVLFFYLLCTKGGFPRICLWGPILLIGLYVRFHRRLAAALKEKAIERIPSLFFNCNVSVPLIVLFFVIVGVIWGSA